MQNDLISKSEVINLLCNLHIDNLAVNDKRVTEYIREIPIAYNVEKVVAELEQEQKNEVKAGVCTSGLMHYLTAVAIVRNGGRSSNEQISIFYR